MPGCLGLDAMWRLVGFTWPGCGCRWPGRCGAQSEVGVHRAGVGCDDMKLVTYEIDVKRVIETQAWSAIGDARLLWPMARKFMSPTWLLRVGLFQAWGDGRGAA